MTTTLNVGDPVWAVTGTGGDEFRVYGLFPTRQEAIQVMGRLAVFSYDPAVPDYFHVVEWKWGVPNYHGFDAS